MEASSAVSRPISRLPFTEKRFSVPHKPFRVKVSLDCPSVSVPTKRFSGNLRLVKEEWTVSRLCKNPFSKGYGGLGFSDASHVMYYCEGATCRSNVKEEKKRKKLLKGLEKDLFSFSGMFNGAEIEGNLAGEVKGKMISEATNVLLTQLQQLKAEQKEIKKRRKAMKAAQKEMRSPREAVDSSSSSSESSDSECEVVTMNRLRNSLLTKPSPDPQAPVEEATLSLTESEPVEETTLSLTESEPILLYPVQELSIPAQLEKSAVSSAMNQIRNKPAETCCSGSPLHCSGSPLPTAAVESIGGERMEEKGERIQVCMGGKCKKSGAAELMEAFQRSLGSQGSVVGCKCMGKCKDGPNVRVSSNNGEEGVLKALCIGVGLEDVGSIVANYLGGNKDVGLVAA
ncbi:hypothetical protein AMTRI_Chr02g223970 [Amborella trichopoda]|uniref:Diacylglycerol acyltransferase n=1 Tax=Amborella trichopoda TaxID=13333 RepID=W1NWL2_AMBTC|nr:diacylglycerol O-acyltransferase 3, cytosolic [Amborella trichopoda]ERN02032.1 hypothetical protein AMTR_s00045p00115420 [Amborella trichopoda]|eukprot:XP_006840357.1 diacylglycerol O-acyltransferase 3, cytosolic [Amborella trichopoda]